MIKFFKNLFKKKETWVFVSYQISLADNKRGFGDFFEPISNFNKTDFILNDVKEYIKQFLKEDYGYEDVSIVILFFKTWKQ